MPAPRQRAARPSHTCRGVDVALLETPGPFLAAPGRLLLVLPPPPGRWYPSPSRCRVLQGAPGASGLAGGLVLKVRLMFQASK